MDYQNKTVRRLGYLLPADESVFEPGLRELIVHMADMDSCFKKNATARTWTIQVRYVRLAAMKWRSLALWR